MAMDALGSEDGVVAVLQRVRFEVDMGSTSALQVLVAMADEGGLHRQQILCDGGMKELALVLENGGPEAKQLAAMTIARLPLYKLEMNVNASVSVERCITPLVKMIEQQVDEQIPERAVEALLALLAVPMSREVLETNGGVPRLVGLLKYGSDKAKQLAALTLHNLAVGDSAMQRKIGNKGVAGLISLVKETAAETVEMASLALIPLVRLKVNIRRLEACRGIRVLACEGLKHTSQRAQENVATVLLQLSQDRQMASRLGGISGVISTLIGLARDGNEASVCLAVEILKNLSSEEENETRIETCDGIPVLVDVFHTAKYPAKNNAGSILLKFARHGTHMQHVIGEAGGILACVDVAGSSNLAWRMSALRILRELVRLQDNQTPIAIYGGIDVLIAALRHDCTDGKHLAALTLEDLAEQDGVLSRWIGAKGAIAPLLEIAWRQSAGEQFETALRILRTLSSVDENRQRIASNGGIIILTHMLESERDKGKADIVAALENLAACDVLGRQIGDTGAIPLLLKLTQHPDEEVVVGAVRTLWDLSFLEENKTRIKSNGGLDALQRVWEEGSKDAQVFAELALWSVEPQNSTHKRSRESMESDFA